MLLASPLLKLRFPNAPFRNFKIGWTKFENEEIETILKAREID
jgi:hypothetical protein